uniref:Uncharacterized protein n=1 Tax=Amphimedon queenslandica TaxID=400682 RepID=A0A1X7VV81_AMPQE
MLLILLVHGVTARWFEFFRQSPSSDQLLILPLFSSPSFLFLSPFLFPPSL